jgi:hypothetical protein
LVAVGAGVGVTLAWAAWLVPVFENAAIDSAKVMANIIKSERLNILLLLNTYPIRTT